MPATALHVTEESLRFAVHAELEAAKETAIASRYDQQVIALATVSSVAITYFEALSFRDRIALAESNVAAAEQMLGGIHAQFRDGTVTDLNIAHFRKLLAAETDPVKLQTIERRLSAEEAKILQEEMRGLKLRPALAGFGLTMIGPLLLHEGSEEQKREHLPKIVRGEIRWCQGYSEPGAGSDLAGLQTRAVADGDDFILNGQKTWTSYADRADLPAI